MSTGYTSPVETIETDPPDRLPEDGIGLCLSGGGYRAMLFHVGAIWRLNEAGYLPKLARISSVSGGSISAAYLGLKWRDLQFDAGVATNLKSEFVAGIRDLASHSIDVGSVLLGKIWRGGTPGRVAAAYARYLFDAKTLQDLPDDPPRFVINATNVQSGALWRFMRPYMRDWRVGEVASPKTKLAVAVAASSAFPPFLSPLVLKLRARDFTPDTGRGLQKKPYTTRVLLTDGGVYDNLGLETVWKRYATVLVSDAGGRMAPEPRPARDWGRHAIRVLGVIDNQVRSLRKRQLIDSYKLRDVLIAEGLAPDSDEVRRVSRQGAYWGIRTNIAGYDVKDPLDCPHEKTLKLADVDTRLAELAPPVQEKLIDWGYAVCDAALRRHVDPSLPKPDGFPYEIGVG